MKLHIIVLKTVLKASSIQYVANHFSKGYKLEIVMYKVCVNQAEECLTMSGLAGIKASSIEILNNLKGDSCLFHGKCRSASELQFR